MIGAGHQWSAIQGYTLTQLRMFVHAAGQQDRRRLIAAAIAARTAQAPEEAFRKALRELER